MQRCFSVWHSLCLLKRHKDAFVPPIVHLINLSLKQNSFPSAWKQATVSPIYKSGDLHEASKYRPISKLPILSKVTEKVAIKQLTAYLNTGNFGLLPMQFGSRQIKSQLDGERRGDCCCILRFAQSHWFSKSQCSLISKRSRAVCLSSTKQSDKRLFWGSVRCVWSCVKNVHICSLPHRPDESSKMVTLRKCQWPL